MYSAWKKAMRHSKLIALGLFVVLLLAAFVLGMLFEEKLDERKEKLREDRSVVEELNNHSVLPSRSSTPSTQSSSNHSEKVDTSTWTVFRNTHFNFEIAYPPQFKDIQKLDQNTFTLTLYDPEETDLSRRYRVSVKEGASTTLQLVEEYLVGKQAPYAKIIMNGHQALAVSARDASFPCGGFTVLAHNDLLYQIFDTCLGESAIGRAMSASFRYVR